MRVAVDKSEVRGSVDIPASKSLTIRSLMCAALAGGESSIVTPLLCDDTAAAVSVLSKVGVGIRQEEDVWKVNGRGFREPHEDLFCGASATTLRFMTAVCSLVPGRSRLTADPDMPLRPVSSLVQALDRLGVRCVTRQDGAPVVVEGGTLKGGLTELPGDISSQYISALLLIAPFADDSVTIRLTSPLASGPYVDMTLSCMAHFGIKVDCPAADEFRVSRQDYRPASYRVEGDWSSASYLLALGAVAGGVTVTNMNPASLQGDKVMLDLLRQMGVEVEVNGHAVTVGESRLKAIRADMSDCIDLLPTVGVLAAVAEGVSELSGISRGRIKESDRVAAVRDALRRLGIDVAEEEDRLLITGSRPQGAVVESRNDHRIAMAFSVLGAACGGVVINEAECVAKTFPQFWDILKSIGGRVRINE